MHFRKHLPGLALGVIMTVAGCTSSNPEQPSSSGSGSSSALSPSIVSPKPLQPGNGVTVANLSQPITLVAQSAVTTKPATLTYTFEVAFDASFASKAQTKDNVAEGAGGQTNVKLDPLLPSNTYYWHVRAQGGGTIGIFGPAYKFTVGPQIAIGPPAPISPANGASTTNPPILIVNNAGKTGPVPALVYTFEISTTSSFTSIFTSATVGEGPFQTIFTPQVAFNPTTTYFWRVTAVDQQDGISSQPSPVQSFTPSLLSQAAQKAQLEGIVLWPGQQPPGLNGHEVMGNFWNVEPITAWTGEQFLNPPLDVLRVFDLLDRGFAPQDAIDWMNGHGYGTTAAYYPSIVVIAFSYEYMAFVNGRWDLVLRVGA